MDPLFWGFLVEVGGSGLIGLIGFGFRVQGWGFQGLGVLNAFLSLSGLGRSVGSWVGPKPQTPKP